MFAVLDKIYNLLPFLGFLEHIPHFVRCPMRLLQLEDALYVFVVYNRWRFWVLGKHC